MNPATGHDAVIWHDVENGSYTADLPLWHQLAAGAGSSGVLELGCGTGRVALDLGRAGRTVVGIDTEAPLVAATTDRAAASGLDVSALRGDMRELPFDGRFPLVVAPMQVIQLLEGPKERAVALAEMARVAAPGGLVSIAIVEDVEPVGAAPGSGFEQPLPDVAEVDGHVYSSLPLDVAIAGGRMEVRRLRQIVAPDGELSDAIEELCLYELSAGVLEGEAVVAGLRPAGRREIPATDAHMASTVVILEAAR